VPDIAIKKIEAMRLGSGSRCVTHTSLTKGELTTEYELRP
jgi:hypothetical protein